MKKKLLLLLISLGVFFLLSGCSVASYSSHLTITDANGAGTKTLTLMIRKDKESTFRATRKNEDSPLVFVSSFIYNNSTYFPKGYQAFADFVLSKLPEKGYTATVDESDENYVYINFSYSFESFEEYTEKTKALMGEDKWIKGEFVDPQLYVSRIVREESEHYGKAALTFAESSGISGALAAELIEIGLSEEAVEAGVLSPFGDSFENPDCRFAYENLGLDYATFYDYACEKFLLTPSKFLGYADGIYCSFMSDDFKSFDGNVQITRYVEDDGSYQLTHAIPEYLGVSFFKAEDVTEAVDGAEVSVLAKYAPGKSSLATLPDISTLNIIVYDEPEPTFPTEPTKPKEYSSEQVMDLLVYWSIYIICGCVLIAVISAAVKKIIKKYRR